jgi:putative ABC transport system permease protein
MMRSLNSLAFGSMRQYRLRTILSVIVIAMGVAIIVATDLLSSALQDGITSAGGDQGMLGFIINLIDTMFSFVGLVILAVAGFLIFNAFAMSIVQRRQQIGALRTLGTTRRQIMQLMLVEAGITAILGTILGLLLGPLLGKGIITLMEKVGGQMFVFGDGSIASSTLALAVVLGTGVTLISVFIPVRSAMQVAPLAVLREQAAAGIDPTPIRRTIIGLLIIGVLALYLISAPPGEWVRPPWDTLLAGLFMLAWLVCLGLVLSGLIGRVGQGLRAPLTRRWGATGRLIADNLQRGRRRVTLTILTLTTGLAMIVALTGMMTFFFKEMAVKTLQNAAEAKLYILAPFDIEAGVGAMAGKSMSDLQIPAAIVQNAQGEFGDHTEITQMYLAFPPELAPPLFPGLYSYVLDPHVLQRTGSAFFAFTEGDWISALPLMEAGCGVLVSPAVAAAHNAGLGDAFTVTGARGPIECRVAGIGSAPVGISIIGNAAAADFDIPDNPLFLMIMPRLGTDPAQLASDLGEFVAQHNGVWDTTVDFVIDFQRTNTDSLLASMNGVLLLAILAAALGVVNTSIISVTERRQELGLLRALGCTQRQVRAIVAGEAAIMGVIGGALGLIAGAGLTVIFVTVNGGNSMGVYDLPLWASAGRSVQPALLIGLVGLILAPMIAAAAAWLPTRSILHGSPVQILTSKR